MTCFFSLSSLPVQRSPRTSPPDHAPIFAYDYLCMYLLAWTLRLNVRFITIIFILRQQTSRKHRTKHSTECGAARRVEQVEYEAPKLRTLATLRSEMWVG